MRVLVTGGTGYLGAAIVRALIAGGHTPVVFARRAAQAKVAGEAFDGDVRDGPAVLRAARNADAIVHTAALVSIWHRQPSTFDEVNVGGLEAVLAAARTLGIRRIVYTSSFLAHPPAGSQVPLRANDYQRTKVRAGGIAHEAIRAGLPLVSLVPGVVYGPGTQTEGNLIGRMVRDHLAGRLPGLVGADRCWSYAYVDDVAEAHVRALLPQIEPGEYVLGGDNQPQMRVFEIVREETGLPVPRRIPLPAAFAVACAEELRARVTGRLPSITRGVVEILRHDWSLDSARSVDKLNYRTRPLALGVRALLSAGSYRAPWTRFCTPDHDNPASSFEEGGIMMMASCPFCGVGTDLPHETQEACIAALQVEIARMRQVVDRLHTPGDDISGEEPKTANPSDGRR